MDGHENDTEFKRSEQKCEKCRGAWMCFLCIACDSQESTALHDAQLHLDASRPEDDIETGSCDRKLPIHVTNIIQYPIHHSDADRTC